MDIRLSPVSTPGLGRAGLPAAGRAAVKSSPESGFQGAFTSALKSASAAQDQASALQKDVLLDKPNASIEETMMAMQKAQISFQSALHVRNRMVQAYTDIMNMQV